MAHVRDGFSPQTNIVRQNGQRGVLISIIKSGGASTLDIVRNLLDELPKGATGKILKREIVPPSPLAEASAQAGS